MKIYLISDLHLEMDDYFEFPKIAVDVVVLAGDIHRGGKVFDFAAKCRLHFHAPVVVVAGNHEYYRRDYLKQIAEFRRDAAKLKNIFFLENDRVVIGNARFLGCTLWSDFALYGQAHVDESKAIARRNINDFRVIEYGSRQFTPDDASLLHRESRAWLEQQLAQPFNGKTIVVTHFLPHRAGIHPRHAAFGGDHLTPYFMTDCAPLMQQYSIDTWLYGHTHSSVDLIVDGGTRLVSNQRGYPNEAEIYTRFDPNKIIHIEGAAA